MSKKALRNKYKLTPDADKAIKVLAKLLPKVHRKEKGQLMYTQALIAGAMRKVPLFVNHYINLVNIWQKEGQPGIEYYVKFFNGLKTDDTPTVATEVPHLSMQEAKVIDLRKIADA